MDVDESVDIVQSYLILIEHVQQVVHFFSGNNFKHYPTIRQKLIDCCQQIDNIISLEKNHHNFEALCQQKHQLTMSFTIIENIIKKESNDNKFNEPLSQYSFFCLNNNSQRQVPENETIKNLKSQSKNSSISTEEIPKVRGIHDIIGHHDIKKVLKTLVILPKTQPQLFYNRRICNSILLYGPPGTGKTHLTHALAAEAHAHFYCISASDVLSHYVGETEKKIKNVFENLKGSCEFSILFIDEIDALCRKRTENEQEYTRRIKTEFMFQMSNIADCTNIVVMSATNCPWDLDSAIVRRFQKRIYVPLPNQLERLEFFRFLTNNVNFESDVNECTLLVQRTDGYSGSDIYDVVQSALTFPLNELEDNKIWKYCADGFYEPVSAEQDFSNVICSELGDLPCSSVRARKVRLNDLLNATNVVRRTVTKADVNKYESFNGI
ncbi:hypothetical protein Zmor_020529 [Zophobas morio]|uniref:AAA+ ATPase domain-containing protein n=1 Tax=Zophobas morio TaxID=2755281 RepID=A0AA38I3M2_9CUCU|nr:hypothetical protein Zmor_020529 [Zophobas morio]